MSEATTATAFQFGYRQSPDQARATAAHHRVIVVGAGPVGLTAALGLAQRGHAVVLLDDMDRIGEGSRAICFSKRALEAWDRLDVAGRMLEKGVVWQVGRVFHRDDEIYRFDLLPEPGHKMPAFINLQQYYAEAYLVDAIREEPLIDVRWRNKVTGLTRARDHVHLDIETPEGPYALKCDYLVACDGARSGLRGLIGAAFAGETFEDQFLIADVKMTAEFPTERWFWFDPPFHSGQSALLHKQPDDVWRIDLQLGPDADAQAEREPARVRNRVARMIGHESFDLEWVSVYRFQCRRMQRFVHDRVIFAGDAAHQVSPFGARGANSGIEDAENLVWKLDLALRGSAGPGLLASYDIERIAAADENIAASTRSTDFIAPHNAYEQELRNVALSLARTAPFARRMVNAGRLSVPSVYATPLSTPDTDGWGCGPRPGTSLPDAPLTGSDGRSLYLTDAFKAAGCGFALLTFDAPQLAAPAEVARIDIGATSLGDPGGLCASRYGASRGAAYLLRPDGYVAARFASPSFAAIAAALDRARGFP
jgi:3-(3-hydroxy-phenyl)propionate hydroxylase